MDNKHNSGLEDFFKSSLDKFDQEPDDKVWTGINEMLDKDKSEPKTPLWKKLFPKFYLTLFSALILAFILTQVADAPRIRTATVQDFSSAETRSTTDQKNVITSNELVALENSSATLDEPAEKLNTYPVKKEITNQRQNEKKISGNTTGTSSAVQSLLPSNKDKINISAVTKSSTSINNNITQTLAKSAEPQTATRLANKLLPSIPTLANDQPRFRINSGTRIVKTMDMAQIIKPQHSADRYSRYRAGISARYFNTFVRHSHDWDGCESYGLVQEYELKKNLALSLGLYFNVQHYDVKQANPTEAVDDLVVRQYTARTFSDNSVVEIDASTHYFDLPLGVKWYFGSPISNSSFFINPSIVWQVYFPQTFAFTTSDNRMVFRESNAIVATLGSTNLSLGIEKQLSNNLALQLSMWGEFSFLQLGVQNEKFKMLGFSTSLLFGK